MQVFIPEVFSLLLVVHFFFFSFGCLICLFADWHHRVPFAIKHVWSAKIMHLKNRVVTFFHQGFLEAKSQMMEGGLQF